MALEQNFENLSFGNQVSAVPNESAYDPLVSERICFDFRSIVSIGPALSEECGCAAIFRRLRRLREKLLLFLLVSRCSWGCVDQWAADMTVAPPASASTSYIYTVNEWERVLGPQLAPSQQMFALPQPRCPLTRGSPFHLAVPPHLYRPQRMSYYTLLFSHVLPLASYFYSPDSSIPPPINLRQKLS